MRQQNDDDNNNFDIFQCVRQMYFYFDTISVYLKPKNVGLIKTVYAYYISLKSQV